MMVVSDRKEVVQHFLEENLSTLQQDVETATHVEITTDGMRILRPDGKEVVYEKRSNEEGKEDVYREENLFLNDVKTFEVSSDAGGKLYTVRISPNETNGITLPTEYFIRRLAD